MFSNIGWGEIFFLLIVGLVVIGPERLPGVIEDVRAGIYAARKAINNAKAELNGELGEDFAEFRKPIDTVSQYAAMGPKRAMAKVLFDGDETYMDSFDPRNVESGPRPPAKPNKQAPANQVPANQARPAKPAQPEPQPENPPRQGGGFSWEDIT